MSSSMWRVVALAAATLALSPAEARADEAPEPVEAQPLPAPRIPDVAVIDQNGRDLHFVSDLVRDRRVAIQFVFTSCTTICKPLSAVYARAQELLGDRADVRLISVSIDPSTDTPERLRAHAEKFRAGPQWTLVTGSERDIGELLRAFGVGGDLSSHTAFVTVGDARTGRWTRVWGLAPAEKLVEALDRVAAR